MLELFKGQIDIEKLKGMSYKEALLLRDSRITRLKKEQEELERERSMEDEKMNREKARNRILAK